VIRRDISPACGQPGISVAEVKDVHAKRSSGGDLMLVVKFIDPRSGSALCEDIIMLEGAGRDMGKAKLSMLGIPPDREEFDEILLIGQRCRLALKLDNYQGVDRLKVDIKAEGFKCGYAALTEPERAAAEAPVLDDRDVPF